MGMDKIKASYSYTVPSDGTTLGGGKPPPKPPGVRPSEAYAQRIARKLILVWLLLAFAACLWSLWVVPQMGPNNDHLALLDQTSRLLAGEKPYVDYVDVNPPLIHLLYALPVFIAESTKTPPMESLVACTYILIATSLLLSMRILRRGGASVNTSRLAASALACGLLVMPMVSQFFGDRSHLMIVLISPWMILFSPLVDRASVPRRWRLLAALMGAVGFAIKPYYYIFYFATCAWEFYQKRSLSPILRGREHYIIWAGGALYVAIVLLYFRPYVFSVLPVGFYTYKSLAWGFSQKVDMITSSMSYYMAVGLAGTLALFLISSKRFDAVLQYLLFVLAASMASFLIDAGWHYTRYPVIITSLLLAVAATGKLVRYCLELPNRQRALVRGLVVSGVSLGCIVMWFIVPVSERVEIDLAQEYAYNHTLDSHWIPEAARVRIDRALEQYPRFLFLNLNVWAEHLQQPGKPFKHVGRFDYLWPLPGTVALDNPQHKQQFRFLADYLDASIADDLERRKPQLVIIDSSPQLRRLPDNFSILDFLKKGDKFTKAWKRFRKLDTISTCTTTQLDLCSYDLYVAK